MLNNRSNRTLYFLIILIFIISITLSGCRSQGIISTSENSNTSTVSPIPTSKDNGTSDNNADIKINGIYKLNIIGKEPASIGLKSTDKEHILANLGVVQGNTNSGYFLAGRIFFNGDSISGFRLGGNTSIFDKRLIQRFDINNAPEKIDINKLVVIYYSKPSIESDHQVIAYSKIVDMKNKVNNISQIGYSGKVNSSDIIADVVAVIKDNKKYKLISNSMIYNVQGNMPEEMINSAIELPKEEFPTVDIKKIFVVYLSSLNIAKTSNSDQEYSAKVITYSPVTEGSPINMDEQGL